MDEMRYKELKIEYTSYLAEAEMVNTKIDTLFKDNPEFFRVLLKKYNLKPLVGHFRHSARAVPVGWENQE